jgi:hypothetical protein
MLDYVKKNKVLNADGSLAKFEPKTVLVNNIHKVLKLRAHKKAIGFKFSNLMRYLQKNQFSEEQLRIERAQNMLKGIYPIFEEKMWQLLTDPVDRLIMIQ